MGLYFPEIEHLDTGLYDIAIDVDGNHCDQSVVVILKSGTCQIEQVSEVRKIVCCKDCIHRPLDKERPDQKDYGIDVEFPLLDDECPYHCGDPWYNERPKDNWFCHKGEKANGER